MCGICGVVDFDGRPVDHALVKRMADVIWHRGPDGEGFHFNTGQQQSANGASAHKQQGNAALAARRLAIIDVAAGHQPITNEDGSIGVAFNGEIYNFAGLQKELEAKGHQFRTHCDTEVIVHAYEEWGDECVHRFNGMFAFAIWDEPRQRLLLARDRMGVKPLVYWQHGRRLLFASEIKCLLQDPAVEREVDCDVLVQYLSFFAVPDPGSLFRGIRRVPAGHLLIFEAGQARLQKYWDIKFHEPSHRNEKQWLDELEALLEDAVRIRLISEVPLGAFLSGGIDSGLVVAMMARAGGSIKTCSIEFTPGYSEADHARLVANKFQTDHLEYSFGREESWAALPQMVWHHDEPSQSLIQQWWVSKAARERVTVSLSGLGGDELFSGYPSHTAAQRFHYLDKVPPSVRRGLLSMTAGARGHGAKLNRFLQIMDLSPEERFASRYLHTTEANDRNNLLSPEMRLVANTSAGSDYLMGLFEGANSPDFRNRLLYVFQKGYLANELLRATDSMSMAHSLEVRTPFLDYRLVELAARMPMSMKMRGFTLKYALRKLAERLLPPEISQRRKSGFTTPLGSWVVPASETFVRDHLSEATVKKRGYLNPDKVNQLLNEHFSGGADRSHWIVMLLTFELWYKLFIEMSIPAPKEAPALARYK